MASVWGRKELHLPDGSTVEAITPVVLSASRATDIPAFHSRWFLDRLQAGWFAWVNPFNRKAVQYVSTEKLRAIVFWSKNPLPLLKQRVELDQYGFNYYVQFTLNDYEQEGYEPGIPSLQRRLDTFRHMVDELGYGRVVWRWDPVLLGNGLTVEPVLERIERLGEMLVPLTDSLVFSFADIAAYRKVTANLARLPGWNRQDADAAELSGQQQQAFAAGLHTLLHKWRLVNPAFQIATCAEDLDLDRYAIHHNRCIDDERLARLFPEDRSLMEFLGRAPRPGELFASRGPRKDPGQRKACGCILSKDIGSYDTCAHLCAYCYANTSATAVRANFGRLTAASPSLLPLTGQDDAVAARIPQRKSPVEEIL